MIIEVMIMTLYHASYQSPLGPMSLVADNSYLLGAWFIDQKYFQAGLEQDLFLEKTTPVLKQAIDWLDTYFSGEIPAKPQFIKANASPFQAKVWTQLLTIPLGQTSSYGVIAKAIDCASAQAVGGAVGRNPLSIFVPCHRVLASDGRLSNYAGGIDKKEWLLNHEKTILEKERK